MPVHATSLDIPCSMASARARKTLTPSPPALRTIGGHGELIFTDQTNTVSSPVNKSEIQPPDHDRSRCALLTPSPSTPPSGPRQDSSLPGTSRPSVIVYKVATGPNLVGSRDVIRVSYGEGHRKRTHPTSFGHRNKDRKLGPSRRARPQKEYGSAPKRDDKAKHLHRKSIRPKLCSSRRYCDEKRSPSADRQKADTEVSGKLPPAERVEGDMAWDFGAGPETCLRRVDADRSRVRVGGLTSVRMIPRSAVDGEIGPAAIPTTT
ncbi:hypothetical protein BC826DRAFT_358175 [Russula brevipes]|nr:hypothetical protein BC826DRAFT_358175 [Russula brevipes]